MVTMPMLNPEHVVDARAVNKEVPERFVDAGEAGKFLSLSRRRVLDLARAGKLPGHPVGDGARRVWRFRLSELAAAVTESVFTSAEKTTIRKPQFAGRGLTGGE